MRYAFPITAALLLGGTAATLALQSPAISSPAAAPGGDVELTSAPRAGAPMSFADLVARLQPSVVNITTRQKVQVATNWNPFTNERTPVVKQQEGGGSGFIISADGLIVTNNHVIASGDNNDKLVDSVMVKLSDGRELKAEIIGRDIASDLAVLKINTTGLPFVEFGDSAKTRVGDWVVAIGNPFGLGSSVTAGIVSALQRNTGQGGAYDRFIQTDTAINQGNSGGPLFDLNGRVIGINNRLISPVGVNIGLNFSIPAESAIPIVDALKTKKPVSRGYLGIQIAPVDENVAAALGLEKRHGELIQGVTPGEGAAKAGLKEGDVVTKINGRDVTPEQTLSYIVANIAPGTKVPVALIRDGKAMTVTAVVGQRPSEEKLATRTFNPEEKKPAASGGADGANAKLSKLLGITVLPLDAVIAGDVGIDPRTQGVVIDDPQAGSVADERLQRGFVIMTAAGKAVTSPEALLAQVDATRKLNRGAIMLTIRARGIPSAQIAVKLAE